MAISSKILTLWQQHSLASFPKGDKEVEGVSLTVLDAEIVGCIRMYINNGGRLDYQRVLDLRNRLIDLNTIILFLDKDELNYFSQLKELADLILEGVEKN